MSDTNCPNCGAVITGPKCEYCGTVFKHDDSNCIFLDGNAIIESIAAGIITPNEARRRMGLLEAEELQKRRNTEIINGLAGMKWGVRKETV